MVGGLVEQQHLGVADEQLRQRDAHLPAAGELAGQTRHVRFGESKAEQNAAHLRLDGVAAEHLERIACVPRRQAAPRWGSRRLGLEFVEAALGLEHLDLRKLMTSSKMGFSPSR